MTVEMSGPLFDGRALREVRLLIVDAEDAIGQEAVNMVRTQLRSVLQNPTGAYESRIHTERQGDDVAVTDGGVVYGPWLEGTSSRNQSTRFKGYATFRKVAQRIDERAGVIANSRAALHVGRMN